MIALVRQVRIEGGLPLGSAITPDGRYAVIGTAAGRVARVTLATGEMTSARSGSCSPI